MAEDKVVGSFWVKLGLDTTEMTGGFGMIPIVLNQSLQLFQQFERMGQQAYDSTVGAAVQYAEQLKKTSQITGINTDDLQRLRAAGLATSVSFDSIATSARMMTQRLNEGGESGAELRASLKAIGVEVYDVNGQFKDTNTIFWDTLKGLNGVTNEMERNRLAMQVLGRSWFEIAPLIKEYNIAADAASKIDPIKQADIDKAEKFGTQLDQLIDKFYKIGVTVGIEVIPYVSAGVDLLGNMIDELEWINQGLDPNNPINRNLTFSQWQAARREVLAVQGSRESVDAGTGVRATTTAMKDPYAGLTGSAFDLAYATDKVRDAETALTTALAGKDTDAIKKASVEYHNAQNTLAALKASIDATAASSANLTKSLPSDWKTITGESMIDAGLLGSEGSAMRAYMEQQLAAGVGKQQAVQNWTNYGEALGTNQGKNARAAVTASSTTGTKTTDGTKKTATTPGTADATASMKTEFGKELASLADYTTKFEADLYGTAYPKWEQLEKTHWTALAELARIAYQSILTNAAETINWIGSNPIVQKSAVLSESGYDIDISALPAVTPPSLKSADFSSVVFLAAKQGTNQQQNQQQQGSTTAVQITIVDKTDAGVTLADTAIAKGL